MTRASFDFPVAGDKRHSVTICESDVPLGPALARNAALAVITGIEGASYRPIGAVMAIDATGHSWGSLSSGCIERDVIMHAQAALADSQPRRLRYGRGSPFIDLTLPCGGGLDVLILPRPDRRALGHAATALAERRPASLTLGDTITLHIQPELRLLVFGKGPEAPCFAALATAAGYPTELHTPDNETRQGLAQAHPMPAPRWPTDLRIDARTAVTLFFHDHDWEPPLLAYALKSPALYVGAQGSLRAHRARIAALTAMGLSQAQTDRLASPFGLIPSVRDPRSLAASVLAQVLERARLS
ncbi:XdhC family protein [Paracoccus laeviglucosivorans]|uniref:Xanthine dehydrogenase accessory factor n=1 Tax=Paracoccus laeviglucosivorans TaxID=1197861 RepID=A0A521CB26_9RHOB|nr:XdhC family protein [Paracoccus laeviglucosivorans]SMO56565.1 xanthine dehydrogenase accessory factor [Paracoccus laeviglucosivorans]